MEGFFNGADVVFGVATPARPAAAQGVLAEAPIPSIEPVPIGEGTYTKGISETAPILAETLTSQEGVIPLAIVQTKVTSPATLLVISTSDPFADLSQAMKDGSSLVVTPSSIRSSTICRPDANLSSEGSKDVLKDSDDEPIMKKRISDFDEEESVDHKAEFMGMCLLILLSSFLPFFCYLLFIDIYLCHPSIAISLYFICLFP